MEKLETAIEGLRTDIQDIEKAHAEAANELITSIVAADVRGDSPAQTITTFGAIMAALADAIMARMAASGALDGAVQAVEEQQ